MKIRLLCLDDNLQALNQPLRDVFGAMLAEGAIPTLVGGNSAPFKVRGFGEATLSIEIVSNSHNDPVRVCEEIDKLASGVEFDIVLVDDDWGKFGNIEGQRRILPKVMSAVVGKCPELPIVVLFTQHWRQTDRARAFCELTDEYQGQQRRVTGLEKGDSSGFLFLVQRIVTERKIAEERERLAEENRQLLRQLEAACPKPPNMIGESPLMRKVYQKITVSAPTPANILILGESGTGKEEVAKAIHEGSHRRSARFYPVNCGAITDLVSESELFGHERGAFTGAVSLKRGWFEVATNGTIFLDEIGELSSSIQVKLLRVLQSGEYSRVGGTAILRTEARIIAATNKDLKVEIEKGRFREDLYYRINVFPIQLPSLRERPEDIPLLVDHFLMKACSEYKGQCTRVSEGAWSHFLEYPWPGNVRELENVIERMVLANKDEKELLVSHFPEELLEIPRQSNKDWCPPGLERGKAGTAEDFLNLCEEIASKKGKVTQAEVARQLGISRPAVTQKIGKIGEELNALLNWPRNSSRWTRARNDVMSWGPVRSIGHLGK